MVLTPAMEICAVIGAFIGCMVGTLGPYYNEKKKLGFDDVEIFFEKKFLKATLVAGILSAVTVGGAFPTILANVNPLWSYTTTIVSSAVFALVINLGGNILVGPSVITLEAKRRVLVNQTEDALNDQLDIAAERIMSNIKQKQDELNFEATKQELGELVKAKQKEDAPIETEQVKRVEFTERDNEDPTNP